MSDGVPGGWAESNKESWLSKANVVSSAKGKTVTRAECYPSIVVLHFGDEQLNIEDVGEVFWSKRVVSGDA